MVAQLVDVDRQRLKSLYVLEVVLSESRALQFLLASEVLQFEVVLAYSIFQSDY